MLSDKNDIELKFEVNTNYKNNIDNICDELQKVCDSFGITLKLFIEIDDKFKNFEVFYFTKANSNERLGDEYFKFMESLLDVIQALEDKYTNDKLVFLMGN